MTQDASPSAEALVEAVRMMLEASVVPAMTGAAQYELRVAVHILGIVSRELAARGHEGHDDHERLASTAVLAGIDPALASDSQALALAIRDGVVDPDAPALMALLRARAEAQLAIDSPAYVHRRREA